MAAKYILGALAIAFLLAALRSRWRSGRLTSQSRTWLMIAIMFGAVSTWLFLTQQR
jgi:hypothetical protein